MTVTQNIKNWFFDRPKVLSAVNERCVQLFSSLGAFVRTSARSSIRKRKRVSEPGKPPSSHTDDPVATIRNIQFGYDPFAKTLVVGPLALNQLHALGRGAGGVVNEIDPATLRRGLVPRTLEHGGTNGFREMQLNDGSWVKIGWRAHKDRLVPVWLATPQERAAHKTVTTIQKGNHPVNFYVVPSIIKTRIRFARISPRPFMGPAAVKGLADWRRKFAGRSIRAAA